MGRYVGKVGGERSPAPTMVAMPESEAPLVRRCHLARHQEGLPGAGAMAGPEWGKVGGCGSGVPA